MHPTKHSRAKTVEVILNVSDLTLELSIEDDGVGFQKTTGKGRGLSNMRSRSEEIGGTLTITSDKGTCIHLEIMNQILSAARLEIDSISLPK